MKKTAAKYGEKKIFKAKLERWPNPACDRDYTIDISFPEFTCLCPRSGYPDFATIKLSYIPDKWVVELKSIKLYLNAFRDRHVSHEESVNQIFDAVKDFIKPRYITVIGDFNQRGNVKTVITVSSAQNPDQAS